MSATGVATWDQSKFDKTFKLYMQVASRSLTQAINTKAFFVARKAVWFTDKVEKETITSELGGWVRMARTITRGKNRGKLGTRRKLVLQKSATSEAPLAALIINKRLGKKRTGGFTASGVIMRGGGLYGKAMALAIRNLLTARHRSTAYIRSGWLPAIRTLRKWADTRGAPPEDKSARQIGKPKGSAKPAEIGAEKKIATVINEAWARHDRKNSLLVVGSKGLQVAFDDEVKEMGKYIDRKLKPATDQFNAQQR